MNTTTPQCAAPGCHAKLLVDSRDRGYTTCENCRNEAERLRRDNLPNNSPDQPRSQRPAIGPIAAARRAALGNPKPRPFGGPIPSVNTTGPAGDGHTVDASGNIKARR